MVWLRETYPDARVIAVCVDLGGEPLDIAALTDRAKTYGADDCQVIDARDAFVTDYLWPTLAAGAIYEGKYLLGTATARPLIALKLIEVAQKAGATAIAHGATGKGNDQVRFELAIKALAPELDIIAPWRRWEIRSREDALAYLESRHLPVPFSRTESYSRDGNLWHLSHEGLELEDPANAPDYTRLLQRGVAPWQAPDEAETIEIGFEAGRPISLNGKQSEPVTLLEQLNEIAGRHGVGVIDMVENRLVGLKSRGVYETPGGTVLMEALRQLCALTLDRDTLAFRETVSKEFARLVYDGKWFTPLREGLSAFVDTVMTPVTGTVQLTLYKGNMLSAGVRSPNSIYDPSLASFETGDLYDHRDATGFITLFGLPLKTRALMQQAKKQPHGR